MKATGIIRKLDALGRVSIPPELRRVRGIKMGDPIEFYVDGDTIVMRRYNSADTLEGLAECMRDLVQEYGNAEIAQKVVELQNLIKEAAK